MNKLVRSLTERLSRDRVLSKKFALNGNSLRLFYSPDAQLKYLKKQSAWDTDLQELAIKYIDRDSVVWDVGANVGVFSFCAALMEAKSVIAFEPDVFLASVIQRTIEKNALNASVKVLPVAVAKDTGIANFVIAARGRASNSLESAGGRSQMGGARDVTPVPVFSGDRLAQQLGGTPTFIKIDVEGAELDVLQGFSGVISEAKPIIYVEVGQASKDAVEEFLGAKGYKISANNTEGQNLLCLPACG